MSHEVETMAYVGQRPWHGLGTKVSDLVDVKEMTKAAGLEWTVDKRPLFIKMQGAVTKKVQGKFGLVRSDTNETLDVVGERYTPFQNEEALSFFQKFVATGFMKLETAGSLCQGKFVWGLAKINGTVDVGKNDPIESYVLLLNAHKNGQAMIAQTTNVRVVCQNTLNMALSETNKDGKFRLAHTKAFDEQAKEQAEMTLNMAHKQMQFFRDAAEQMTKVRMTSSEANAFLLAVHEKDDSILLDASKREKVTDFLKEDKRTQRTIMALQKAFEESPGATLDTAKGTLWGAFNAVTFVTDHVGGVTRDNVVRDLWLGYRGDLKRKAFNLAVQYAKTA